MPRFFLSPDEISDSTARISGDDAHHIARSLRMAEGDAVTLCDGTGMEYDARLTKIRDEECILEIVDKRAGRGESPIDVTLFMGYPKADKLELVVQKATELGALEVVPFESSRCIKKQKADRADKVTARLTRIAHEAAKQCGRSRLPSVSESISFGELLKRVPDFDTVLFCYEGAGKEASLQRILSECNESTRRVAVIVGCEGGFSEGEAEKLVGAGALAVSLGERILRCETAPIFALSAIACRFEA